MKQKFRIDVLVMAPICVKLLLQKVAVTIFSITSLGFFELIWGALEDFTLRILLIAAVVSIVTNLIVEDEHREIGKRFFSPKSHKS